MQRGRGRKHEPGMELPARMESRKYSNRDVSVDKHGKEINENQGQLMVINEPLG